MLAMNKIAWPYVNRPHEKINFVILVLDQ
jgi:hypothetical protein